MATTTHDGGAPSGAAGTPPRRGARSDGGLPPAGRARRRRDTRAALLFISPWILGFAVFTLWPVIYSGYLSFTDYDVLTDPEWVGLENYERMLDDSDVRLALWNTFYFTAIHVPLLVVVSLALALLLNQAGRSAGFFRTAFFLPKMTPPVAVGVLLLLLFNGQNGLINQVLSWFGIQGPAWTTDPDWVKPGLILISLWSVGSSVIILLAALRNVPQELYDSARVDGAGFWRVTTRITIPMISGALFFVFIVNSIAGFQTFTEAYTAYFGSGNSTYSNDAALFFAIYLFRQAFEFLNMGYASALAWLLFVIILAITLVQLRVSKRFVYYEGEQR
ncbi:carbohydrate ABC transporter permease [Cellulomonas carbonis]|uniref:Spermidine/putrescine ABC transporter permease n=1 Tax=Cellulomonas carbonis T26 TaxID=947969 RepID=A0A0A0BPK9_9CELL|nr:sugar ABC transporter permease [Cellulomonas carbonis]KGM09024.1 spermidine/putrescine ABC transporter permease [Cellulomonas carbonis T26]GGC17395.1 sugar ABC transporter permease [Cellulomonas carbonis]